MYTFEDLKQIMKTLRAEDGCPWDRAQDHDTLKKHLVEECAEVLEAIDAHDTENLCEELGDVLFQVMFHSEIEAEQGNFTVDDVVNGICEKMIRRHPRVFGGEIPEVENEKDLLGRDFESGQMARDMNLFVDDDGKAYHIYASEDNSTLHISELTDDYTACSGNYARFFVGRFMEAPAMFKKDGKYYLIMSGCTGWAPNPGRSAVASSIWGPWKELANPFVGADSETSFHSQSTYVLPVPGKPGQFIYMGDRWTPKNAIDGRYIWLPIRFEGEQPVIEWLDEWGIEN